MTKLSELAKTENLESVETIQDLTTETLTASTQRTAPASQLLGSMSSRASGSHRRLSALHDGRFELLERIGAGGMGVVYSAYDAKRSELVALKTLKNMVGASLYGLKREFRSLAGVSHPNLVRLDELFADGEEAFFTMELVSGRPLAKVLKAFLSQGELSTLFGWFSQMAEGLNAIHAAGKIHRDVKPSNVMLDENGRIVILDFGLSCDVERAHESRHQNEVLGTPSYMAPEQILGGDVTPAADWYGFGVMLYEALAGKLPFDGPLYEVLSSKVNHPAPKLDGPWPDALKRIVNGLLVRDPIERPLVTEIRSVLGDTSRVAPRNSPPVPSEKLVEFVGRTAALKTLELRFAESLAGSPSWVMIAGVSGIGKTTLVRRFLAKLAEQGEVAVFESKCYENEAIRYNALDGVIDGLRRYLEGRYLEGRYLEGLPASERRAYCPHHRAALVSVFPVLDGLWNIEASNSTSPSEPGERRRAAFFALWELLGHVATRQPVVLFLDDLQWGDADSARLLRSLLSSPNAPSILLIGSYRSDEREQSTLLRELEAGAYDPAAPIETIELSPLAPDDALVLVERLLPDAGRAQQNQIVEEAKGSPFFLSELARRSSQSREASIVTLSNLVEWGLSGLPASARRLLEVIAISELPISEGFALAATRRMRANRESLVALSTAKLIRGVQVKSAEGVQCYHDRVREAVIASLSKEARKDIHLTIAQLLEAEEVPRPERLVEHFRQAGENQVAAKYASQAGVSAHRELAFEKAVHWFALAQQLGQWDPPMLAELALRYAEALEYSGRGYEAAAHYLKVADKENKPHTTLELRCRAASALLASGHGDEGDKVLEIVLKGVGLRNPRSNAVVLAGFLYQRARIRLRGTSFTRRAEGDVARQQLLKIDAISATAAGYTPRDAIRGAFYASLELRLALDAGEINRIGRALCTEIIYVSNEGPKNAKKVQSLLELAQEIEPEINSSRIRGFLQACRAVVPMLMGRPAAAARPLAEALEILTPTGAGWELTFIQSMWCLAIQWTGKLTETVSIMTRWIVEAEERQDMQALRFYTSYRGFGQIGAGQSGRAQADVARILEQTGEGTDDHARYTAYHTFTLAACYERAAPEVFRRLIQLYEAFYRSPHRYGYLSRVMIRSYTANCWLAISELSADPREELRELRTLLKKLQAEPGELAEAHFYLIRAAVQNREGKPEEAILALRRAAVLFRECEQSLLSEAAHFQLSFLLPDEEGAPIRKQAFQVAEAFQVHDPCRLFQAYTPGYVFRSCNCVQANQQVP